MLTVLGDSIATGYGLADAATQSYPAIVAKTNGYDLHNDAVNGATSTDMLNQLRTEPNRRHHPATQAQSRCHDSRANLLQPTARQWVGRQCGDGYEWHHQSRGGQPGPATPAALSS